jgi:hypothetical protein
MQRGGSGSDNVAIGSYSQHMNGDGAKNVTVGNSTAVDITTGSNNVVLGHEAGTDLTSGAGNVLIGYQAGFTLTTQSNQLYIDNSSTATPLIQGDFNANTLTFNGATTTTGNVTVGGGAAASEVRFLEPSGSGSNYTAFKAQAQGGDITYTLPAADGTSGQVLSTNGSGTLTWATSTSVASINDLTDAKNSGLNFSHSLALGSEPTGTLNNAEFNTAVGVYSMLNITSGDHNVALGYGSLNLLNSGSQNTAVGSTAGQNITTGTQNVCLGFEAGKTLTTGTGNVFIGHQTGSAVAVGTSNTLMISNSNDATPLIQGNFSTDALTFNGSTTTTGSVTVAGKSINTAFSGAAKTAGASPGTAIDAFAGTYEKIAITATGSAGFVQLPAGTEGQVVYLHMTFTANGSNTVTVVNSNSTNTAMVYDGTGSDEIIAHMLYTSTKGWVVFSALEYDN